MKSSIYNRFSRIHFYRKYLYLSVGVLLMYFAHLSDNVGALAWICMLPFLLFLAENRDRRSRVLFSVVLVIAWTVIVLKITTEPIPAVFAILYAVPITLFHLPGYMLWSFKVNSKYSFLLFSASMTVLEWLQYTYTPLASWGSAAYTQVDNLAIAQALSLFGMPGLSFLIYLANASFAILILSKGKRSSAFMASASLTLALLIFGHVRISNYNSVETPYLVTATVGTTSTVSGLPLPSEQKNNDDIRKIIDNSIKAAEAGADLIVWNEAAFYLLPQQEESWVQEFQQLASTQGTSIIASYVLLVSQSPLLYENKYLLISNTGKVLHSYLKHQPVPGEPAIKGKSDLSVFDLDGALIGGAICYDYDFPYLAQAYSKLKADIVAVPSSDWQGIDPLHTQMAAFRAIEQGHSIVRSTRFGLSAAILPTGEFRASQSAFDTNELVMMAELPRSGMVTIYSRTGDVLIYLLVGFIVIFYTVPLLKTRGNHFFRTISSRQPLST